MVAWLLFASTLASANVGDPSRWKPNFKKEVNAPAPADLDARVKAFAERNSKPNQEQLAKTFFALVDLSKVPEAVRHAVAKGDYENCPVSSLHFQL